MAQEFNKYVFLDIETTGLDPVQDLILEIAAIVTDDELNEVARYSSVVVPCGGLHTLERMNDFVRDMHTKNGLIDQINLVSTSPLYKTESVEHDLLHFFRQNKCKPGQIILVGRNVGLFDRKFIAHHMRVLNWVLSHRCLEIGDVLRFMRDFCGIDVVADKRESNHRAMDDCVQALEDARALRDKIKNFKSLAELQIQLQETGIAPAPETAFETAKALEKEIEQDAIKTLENLNLEKAYQPYLG